MTQWKLVQNNSPALELGRHVSGNGVRGEEVPEGEAGLELGMEHSGALTC